MRIKICGITQVEQGEAIAQLGATALGFICVPSSKRYVSGDRLASMTRQLAPSVECIGVFANAHLTQIEGILNHCSLTGIQLHGHESPEFCRQVKQQFPHLELIKAFRIQNADSLIQTAAYFDAIDTLLLDAYHPQQLGGTGQTLDWHSLAQFAPPMAWLLAGGLTPHNVTEALAAFALRPTGIDLSSGVERSPGDKDLTLVAQLFEATQRTGNGEDLA